MLPMTFKVFKFSALLKVKKPNWFTSFFYAKQIVATN